MVLDLSIFSLEELYKILSEQEASLERHRVLEPSIKRKHKKEHDLWVAVSHTRLETIRKIRDEIILRKKAESKRETETENG